MGSSPPTVVQAPSQQATVGSSEIKPYAPVVPYLNQIMPQISSQFTANPQLYTGSLVPGESAQTLAARNIYDQVGNTASAQTPLYNALFSADFNRATADPTADPIYQAQLGTISNQARDMTERDKGLAQQQAIQAGQFGLGSTALGELQLLQQQKREELAQRQMTAALGEAENRRIAAQGRVPDMGNQALSAQMTPATLQEAIGRSVESRKAAQQMDAARLAQQDQEARRAQLVTMTNLYGGLAGLGSSTQMQQTQKGYNSQVMAGGPSGLQQGLGAAASVASIAVAL
jgi:hypothetical protein|tara:strand:+ start:4349 stop:5212 length:864 start_codon:yes stop_codon:yes gene_type:complete